MIRFHNPAAKTAIATNMHAIPMPSVLRSMPYPETSNRGNVTDMSGMFSGNGQYKNESVTLGWNTNNVTKMTMVRFGNVLGSSGSVIPLFEKQIRTGGPVTVTHKDMTRYFMAIPEAAQLVLLAGTFADKGKVFLLDMGKPIKIEKMARQMIELSGLSVKDNNNEEGDIEIVYTGKRPGEKLFEELLIDIEKMEKTEHPKILSSDENYKGKISLNEILNHIEIYLKNNEEIKLKEYILKISS